MTMRRRGDNAREHYPTLLQLLPTLWFRQDESVTIAMVFGVANDAHRGTAVPLLRLQSAFLDPIDPVGYGVVSTVSTNSSAIVASCAGEAMCPHLWQRR